MSSSTACRAARLPWMSLRMAIMGCFSGRKRLALQTAEQVVGQLVGRGITVHRLTRQAALADALQGGIGRGRVQGARRGQTGGGKFGRSVQAAPRIDKGRPAGEQLT